jgi:hypothetical protein
MSTGKSQVVVRVALALLFSVVLTGGVNVSLTTPTSESKAVGTEITPSGSYSTGYGTLSVSAQCTGGPGEGTTTNWSWDEEQITKSSGTWTCKTSFTVNNGPGFWSCGVGETGDPTNDGNDMASGEIFVP